MHTAVALFETVVHTAVALFQALVDAIMAALEVLTPTWVVLHELLEGFWIALFQRLELSPAPAVPTLHELLIFVRVIRLEVFQSLLHTGPMPLPPLLKPLGVLLPEALKMLPAAAAKFVDGPFVGFGVGLFQVGETLSQLCLAIRNGLTERLGVLFFQRPQLL